MSASSWCASNLVCVCMGKGRRRGRGEQEEEEEEEEEYVCVCVLVSQASLFFYEGARAEGGGKKSLVT